MTGGEVDWGSFLPVRKHHLFFWEFSKQSVWSGGVYTAKRFIDVDLWCCESPNIHVDFETLDTLTGKTHCGEFVVCRERKDTAHISSLQSHFILCSLLAAIFLFMLNRCVVVDLLVTPQRNIKRTQTYFVRSRHWQYLRKILASHVHAHIHTRAPIGKLEERWRKEHFKRKKRRKARLVHRLNNITLKTPTYTHAHKDKKYLIYKQVSLKQYLRINKKKIKTKIAML